MDIAWANNGRDVRMFGGTLTNHVILFGRKKVGRVDLWVEGQGGGRRAEGGAVVGQKMVTIV